MSGANSADLRSHAAWPKMSSSFLAACKKRAADAGDAGGGKRAAADGLAGAMAGLSLAGGAGLLDEPAFWSKEGGAPLLRRNGGFLTAGSGVAAELRARISKWPALCGADASAAESGEGCEDEAALRIFLRDAERTFMDEGHRTRMITLLKRVWPENRDYHQGLGYVSSLLMLLFDADTTARILLRLTREERYTPGYWRAAPEPYVRDAMVYARLVQEREPEVAQLLQAACVVPEAYASKWFVGLCIHVLPYEALLSFVEAFLTEGHLFLFKFSLALIAAIKPRLLECKPTQVNVILELLRLDVTVYPDDTEGGAFFTRLVADAGAVELEPAKIASLREEEGVKLEEKMRRTREREAAMAAEESDDEIVFSDESDD